MADISIVDDEVRIRFSFGDGLLAFKPRGLRLSREQIVDVRHERAPSWGRWWYGLRLGGSDIPGVVRAGRFVRKREAEFWSVHNPDKTVVIELVGNKYDRVIVDVRDPEFVIAALRP